MIQPQQIIIRLVVATVLGAIVGLERERLERAAGLRTHALVGVGAALFMLVSAFGFADVLGTRQVALDPSRIAAQVVSGIGFLGAGTIILQREIIRGLTTAASVWAVAAIGLAVGGGLYLAAVSATVLTLLILVGLKPIERRFFTRRQHRLLSLVVDRRTTSLFAIETAVEKAGLHLERVLIRPGHESDEDHVEIVFNRTRGTNLSSLLDRLRQVPGVREITSDRAVPSAERAATIDIDADAGGSVS